MNNVKFDFDVNILRSLKWWSEKKTVIPKLLQQKQYWYFQYQLQVSFHIPLSLKSTPISKIGAECVKAPIARKFTLVFA